MKNIFMCVKSCSAYTNWCRQTIKHLKVICNIILCEKCDKHDVNEQIFNFISD
jgi:hypothetical protein